MKNLTLIFVFALLLSPASFAGQRYTYGAGQFADGSMPDTRFVLDIHHDGLLATKMLGSIYGRRVAWEKLKETATNGVTQTLYSNSDPNGHETLMMVIRGEVKSSVELHTWNIKFDKDTLGHAQRKYGIEHYPRFYFTKCFSTQ
jgi:hypothetical protein